MVRLHDENKSLVDLPGRIEGLLVKSEASAVELNLAIHSLDFSEQDLQTQGTSSGQLTIHISQWSPERSAESWSTHQSRVLRKV